MRTRSVVLATTLTVGLVAGVGSSALAIAFVPGDSSGVIDGVQAIASPTQDPAEGSIPWFITGSPVTVAAPETIVIDAGGPAAKPAASTEAKHTEVEPTEAKPTEAKPTEDKAQNAAEEKAKKDAAEQAKKAAEEQAKKDKAAEEQAKKAAEEQAKKDKTKKDKKAAEEQADQ